SKLTQKQENFCQNIFKGLSQRQSYIQAGYSPNMLPATIDRNAFTIANKNKVLARLAELRAEVKSKLIASVIERQERLSVFIRENNYSKFGINRQSNIQAVDILNKMDKIYDTAPAGSVTYQNVTQVFIQAAVNEGNIKPFKEIVEGEKE
ncbi:MAG: terminase small subunit, partial [Gammaproteobacteria bacterium]|nr:terminase small subunit [Gammaproteobacteria bacterium]MBU2685537.1 terminase small subunit [Gammaproteobacteria bacterium]